MATIKQCKLLSARAQEAGIEWKFEDGRDLSNQEIDEKLAHFAKVKLENDKVEAKQEEPIKVDSVRFGLACKVVLQKYEHFDVIDEKKFVERVQRVYDVMSVAERKIR